MFNYPNLLEKVNRLIYSNRLAIVVVAAYCCVIASADTQFPNKTAIVAEKVILECNFGNTVPQNHQLVWELIETMKAQYLN